VAGENLYGLSYAHLNRGDLNGTRGRIYGWHGSGAIGMIGLAKKIWIPLVIVIVVAIAGFTVHRIRTFFGADGIIVTPKVFADDPEPFDPKVVKYEIFGSGSYADINYLDLDAKPQRIDGAGLPWSLTLQTTAPSAAPNIVAQGDGSSITCRITVDDEIKDERTSNGLNAQTFCFVKSA
jgi:hypothetical protein